MAHTEHKVVVGDRGRVVLPSEVRAEMDLKPGTPMLLRTEADGSLRLRPYRSVAESNRGMLADIAPADESMVNELLAERRREAAREDSD
ncbi:MAG: AbrB/MazE/SpoVT family DNA-binding domain-containing protein [Gammaproteobacteria bacterium]